MREIIGFFKQIMGTKQSKKQDFSFLSDEAIREIKDDRLKHSSIAEALKNIILGCPLPFTVGIFGKWGTGKSTIAYFLKSKLNEKKGKIAIIDFDVWKYEGDSLRKQFLLTLEKQLKKQKILTKKYKLNPRMIASTSRGFKGKITINKEKVGQFVIYIVSILVVLAIVGFKIFKIAPQILPSYLASLMSSLFTGATILALFQIGSQVITADTETLSFDKFKDPDEFEQEFEKLIKNIKVDRVLIIIDNLDRCTHSKAVELLSTIKTFLEPKSKKCIFLIQCDENAIKKHLESVYLKSEKSEDGELENKKSKNTAFDADEFLRKFFNTSVKIPPFIDVDLEEYTKELLQKTDVPVFRNNSDLITVITQAFRDNPRQIKQFINTLLSHYLLALERESGIDPVIKQSGIITGNPAFLAKFLIIRQEWPEFYNAIIEDPKKIDDYASREVDLRNFMVGTSITKADNIRVFIYFKQSSRRLRLPGGIDDDLEIALEDNKSDDVIRIIQELKAKNIKDNVITDFITLLIQKNEGNRQNLINIINLTAFSREKTGLEVQSAFCEKITKVINNSLLNQLYILNIDFVFLVVKRSRPVLRVSIISRYVEILGYAKDAEAIKRIPDYSKYVLELVSYINTNRELFASKKKDVQTALINAHFDNIDVMVVFEKNKLAINDFITSELLVKLVGSIAETDLSAIHSEEINLFNKKIQFVLACKKIIDSAVIEAIIEKITTLITAQNKAPESTEKKVNLKMLLGKIELILKEYSEMIQDKQKADTLSDAIVEGISKYSDHETRGYFLAPLLYLNNIVSDTKKSLIEQTMKSFAQSATSSVVESFLAGKDDKFKQSFFDVTKEDFEAKATKDEDILKFIWGIKDEDGRDALLVRLLATPNYVFALNMLEAENYKVKDSQKIVNLLLDKVIALDVAKRAPVLNAINKMKCAKNKELREKYAKLLQKMIIDKEVASQEVAFNAYVEAKEFLPHLIKLPLTVAIIEWLSGLDLVNINHTFALKTAFLYWDKISSTHKDNLLTILFDRIIAKTSKVEEVNMALDILYLIKPNYTEYKPHYDIALGRAESEQNPSLREAIKTGLQKLKLPKAKNSFWDKVNKL